jgi:hypothetical protein
MLAVELETSKLIELRVSTKLEDASGVRFLASIIFYFRQAQRCNQDDV